MGCNYDRAELRGLGKKTSSFGVSTLFLGDCLIQQARMHFVYTRKKEKAKDDPVRFDC